MGAAARDMCQPGARVCRHHCFRQAGTCHALTQDGASAHLSQNDKSQGPLQGPARAPVSRGSHWAAFQGVVTHVCPWFSLWLHVSDDKTPSQHWLRRASVPMQSLLHFFLVLAQLWAWLPHLHGAAAAACVRCWSDGCCGQLLCSGPCGRYRATCQSLSRLTAWPGLR